MNPAKIVVSGMRPTGKLHLGHYFGVLKNWVRLQEEYRCYFFVADWHALTTEYQNPKKLSDWTLEMVLDWLACGVDPSRVVLFRQSQVTQHAELQLLLGMITPLSWLERVPTYKEQRQELKDKDLSNYGFLGYPLLQCADVAIYGAHLVPVGQDQVAHLELSREIVRRFNFLYEREVLVEPQPLLTPEAKVPGLDGRKMSKSYGNSIYLSDSESEIREKLKTCVTDPARVRRQDPGNPEVCNLFAYHKIFSTPEEQGEIDAQCRSAAIGCVQCKQKAADNLLSGISEIQNRRRELAQNPEAIRRILQTGAEQAAVAANQTMQQVREVMGL